MRLADYSTKLRLQYVSVALTVVLQDLAAPASTIEVARKVAARLETNSKADLDIICQMLARKIAPQSSQAAQGLRDHKGRRHWVWSPKHPSVEPPLSAAAQQAAHDLGLTHAEFRAMVAAAQKEEMVMTAGWKADHSK